MKKIITCFLFLKALFSVFAQELPDEEELREDQIIQVRNKVRQYCKLMSEYAEDAKKSDQRFDIQKLFSSEDGYTEVFDDLDTNNDTLLIDYLTSITDKYAHSLKFCFQNIESAPIVRARIPKYSTKQFAQIEVTKNIQFKSGKKKTVIFAININLEDYKIWSIEITYSSSKAPGDITNTKDTTKNQRDFTPPKPPETYDVYINSNDTTYGSAYASPQTDVFARETVILTVTPKEGYKFKKWKPEPEGIEKISDSVWTFRMPYDDVKVMAIFKKKIYEGYEFGIWGSLYKPWLRSTVDGVGKSSSKLGGAVGLRVDFPFRFTERLSFRPGVDFAFYYSSFSFDRQPDTLNVTSNLAGLPDNSFIMATEFRGYKERHTAVYLRVPLMVQYQWKNGFYLAAGSQLGFRIHSNCRILSDNIVTKGFSNYTNVWYEDLPHHGFGSYPNLNQKCGKTDFGFSFSGVVEVGIRVLDFKNGDKLYFGSFFDYSFKDISKGKLSKESIVYNENGTPTLNSILLSQKNGNAITDKVQPFAVGVQVRYILSYPISKNTN